jgi:hypothetical protein
MSDSKKSISMGIKLSGIGISLLFGSLFLFGNAPLPSVSNTPAATPSPQSSLQPSMASAPNVSFSGNWNALLVEFVRAQKTEIKALEHRHSLEMKEFKVSQDARLKEWEKAERAARYKFFEEHPLGKERREYIKSFLHRRDELRKQILAEKKQRQVDYEMEYTTLHKGQVDRLEKFKKMVLSREVPSKELWPQAGR